MKHAVLHALAQNMADSLGSGCSLLTGVYELDLFAELRASLCKEVTIDLLTGKVSAPHPSALLQLAAQRAPLALARLCEHHGCSLSEFSYATVRFWEDTTQASPRWDAGNRFDVTIEDRRGRRFTKEYFGWPAKRLVILDAQGRRRPKPPLRDSYVNPQAATPSHPAQP